MQGRFLYIDCIGGMSGDMFLAGLIDLGVPVKAIEEAVGALGIEGWKITSRRARVGVLSCRRVDVKVNGGQPHRKWADIKMMIQSSGLAAPARKRAIAVFESLARAESKIHGEPLGKVHFHEVGAVDSIVDIVGAAAGLELLGVEDALCSPVPLGSGFADCSHGRIPLPAPATLELLKGIETFGVDFEGETVTPTGAAILRTVASSSGVMPAMTIGGIGYGAGWSKWPDRPNVARLVLGKKSDESTDGDAVMIEANIDDMTPQDFEPLMERAFEAGALDVALVGAQMKKNRPGVLVKILAEKRDLTRLSDALLRHSTTIGVRWNEVKRRVLGRREAVIDTTYGKIRAKMTNPPGGGVKLTPEYEDLKKAAEESGVPIGEVRKAFWTVAG